MICLGGSVLPTEWESIGEFNIPQNFCVSYHKVAKFEGKIYTFFQDYHPIEIDHGITNYTSYVYSVSIADGNFRQEQQLYGHQAFQIKSCNNGIAIITFRSYSAGSYGFNCNNFVWCKQNSQSQFTPSEFSWGPLTAASGKGSSCGNTYFFLNDNNFLFYGHIYYNNTHFNIVYYGNSPSAMTNTYKTVPISCAQIAIYYGAGYYCIVDIANDQQYKIGYTSDLSNSFVYLNSNNFQSNDIKSLKYLNNQWVAIIGLKAGQQRISTIHIKTNIATDEPWQIVHPPKILGNIRLFNDIEYDGGFYFFIGLNKDNKLCSWTCTDLNQEWTETIILDGENIACSNAIFNDTNWYLIAYPYNVRKCYLLKKTNATPPNLPAIPPIKTTKATLKTYIKAKDGD